MNVLVRDTVIREEWGGDGISLFGTFLHGCSATRRCELLRTRERLVILDSSYPASSTSWHLMGDPLCWYDHFQIHRGNKLTASTCWLSCLRLILSIHEGLGLIANKSNIEWLIILYGQKDHHEVKHKGAAEGLGFSLMWSVPQDTTLLPSAATSLFSCQEEVKHWGARLGPLSAFS